MNIEAIEKLMSNFYNLDADEQVLELRRIDHKRRTKKRTSATTEGQSI